MAITHKTKTAVIGGTQWNDRTALNVADGATVSFDTQPLPPGTYDAHFHLWLSDGTRASEPPEKLVIV